MKKLSHINKRGKATMVDVSSKKITSRTAEAYAEVKVSEEIFYAIKKNEIKKGDVLTVAKLAGIQAAKKTSDLIPLCHNIFISKIDVELKLNSINKTIEIYSFAKTNAETGIEMEALTAVSIAALTVYDMCKAIDKSILIKEIKLLSKTGGKSGNYCRKNIMDMAQADNVKADEKISSNDLNRFDQFSKNTGKIIAISISKRKGIPKANIQSARLIENYGIEGDVHAGNWHRQVSFLSLESIELMREKGLPNLRPGAFAENITTESIELSNLQIGTKIKLGKEAILEITQIGKECHTKCAIFFKLGDCVMPREGTFAKVIHGGEIFVGDKIEII